MPSFKPGPPPTKQTVRPASGALWRWAPLALISAALAAVWFSGAANYLSFARFVESREALAGAISAHYVLALAAYAGVYVVVVALSIPGASLMTLAGGFFFGGWVGGMVTSLAATLGAVLVFAIARTSLGDALGRRCGSWLERLREGFHEDAVSYMLFLRLTPVFPFWLVNLAPAFLGVRLFTFFWTTLLGVMPATFAYSFAGSGLDSIARAQQAAYNACIAAGRADCKLELSAASLVTRELLIGLAAVGVAALIPVVMKKWRARRARIVRTLEP